MHQGAGTPQRIGKSLSETLKKYLLQPFQDSPKGVTYAGKDIDFVQISFAATFRRPPLKQAGKHRSEAK
jgi:hypothetical protein